MEQNRIISFAQEWASNVVGQASLLISKMCESSGYPVFQEMSDSESVVFMETYLFHLVSTYSMQIKAITDKINSNENQMQKGDLQPSSPEQ